MLRPSDTIVAPATPSAPAPRAIVRVSGDDAFAIVDAIACDAVVMPHAGATDRTLRLGDGIDVPTTCYAFRGPRSSTGEDVVELHLPGSPLFVRLALARLIERGARTAEPGEFTARAFFHGKLDLAAAEGVAATIAAANRRELDAARQLLAGELARRLAPIADDVTSLLALAEAGIDFADEAVDFLPDATLRARLDAIDAALASLATNRARIERLSHEPRIVLTGRPNAGKSTLLNALAGRERAIVSEVAGTTRDALSARVRLRRGTITLVDTAGVDENVAASTVAQAFLPVSEQRPEAIRAGYGTTQTGMSVPPEVLMRDVATGEVARADAVVRVVALDDDGDVGAADLVVYTKRDLVDETNRAPAVCAVTGVGMEDLVARLDALAFAEAGPAGTLAMNVRHVVAIGHARQAVGDARSAIGEGHEFVAASLRDALASIGGVTGVVSADDVLGRIFGSFCIGK